jgi:hypothetical protein
MNIKEYCQDRSESRHALHNVAVAQRMTRQCQAEPVRRTGPDESVGIGWRRGGLARIVAADR